MVEAADRLVTWRASWRTAVMVVAMLFALTVATGLSAVTAGRASGSGGCVSSCADRKIPRWRRVAAARDLHAGSNLPAVVYVGTVFRRRRLRAGTCLWSPCVHFRVVGFVVLVPPLRRRRLLRETTWAPDLRMTSCVAGRGGAVGRRTEDECAEDGAEDDAEEGADDDDAEDYAEDKDEEKEDNAGLTPLAGCYLERRTAQTPVCQEMLHWNR